MALEVVDMIVAPDRGNHPNKPYANGKAAFITVHETANTAAGADALAHGNWVRNAAPYSWEETIDDKRVVLHLKDDWQGWHAGDGFNGPGNTTSKGLELCVADGMDFAAVRENAAQRIAHHLRNGHGYDGVVQHNHWTGKDCPHFLRSEAGAWQALIDRVQAILLEQEIDDMIDDTARAQAETLNAVLVIQRDLARAMSQPGNAVWRVHKALKEKGLLTQPEYTGDYGGRA